MTAVTELSLDRYGFETVENFKREVGGWIQDLKDVRCAAGAARLSRGACDDVKEYFVELNFAQHPDPAERLGSALRDHGLSAETRSITAEDRPIASTLQDAAMECGAGLLVMGAFGHSRVRDFVLGGATEGILSDLRLPVLLSH